MNKTLEILKSIYKPYKYTIKGKATILETMTGEYIIKEVADIKPIYDVVIAAAPDYNIDIIKNKLAIN